MSGLDVRVDPHRCVGTTMCTAFAPEVFTLDGSGQSTVRPGVTPDRAATLDAAGQCPMEAITVRDTATGEQLFP